VIIWIDLNKINPNSTGVTERRRYHSPLRAAQAEETRAALLAATEELLVEHGVEGVTIPEVARRAGVSAPTAYKNFPTADDLMRAFIEDFRPRLGLSIDELADRPASDLPAIAKRNFRIYERFGALLRSAMSSPTWTRARLASSIDRAARVAPIFADRAGKLGPRELRAGLGALYLFVSPQTWRWLRETWGLSAADASRAAAWAMSVLARELWNDPSSLDPVDLENPE
jgi:AcrR family transcriptional regulator